MGVSTFNGLNTALRGLTAQQRALDVTSHNIANIDTPGYSRQEAVLTQAPALDIASGALQNGTGAQLGQGVDVQSYRRLRDDFLDLQWRAQNMSGGQADTTASRLGQAQDILGSGSGSDLGALMDKFWSSWQQLAANPQNAAAKGAVVGAAQGLAAGFQALDTNFGTLETQATTAVGDMLGPAGPIQPIADELAQLNVQINRQQSAGVAPNDMLDRRDLLLDQLSRYGQVSVVPDPTLNANGQPAFPGMVQVSFAGAATPLVSQSTVTMPTTATISPNPGGQLGGLQDAAAKLSGYRASINALAGSLITTINGATTSPVFSGTGSADIAVVATSATMSAGGAGGAAGDNGVALAIAGLRGGAFDVNYAGVVQTIGSDVSNAQNAQTLSTSVLGALDERRASVAGVSIDEEMTNMIRFQRGYQACSRALTTMDETLDTLINRTGKVGM